MVNLLIASENPHKQQKIQDMFSIYEPDIKINKLGNYPLKKIDENKDSFEKNAILKACEYSSEFDGYVVATDGGVVIPALKGWNPLYTKRFCGENTSDVVRIRKMLELMSNKKGAERTMFWQEAIAICKNGKRIFSVSVRGIEGIMAESDDSLKYRKGIWLCSIWNFPQYKNKNFFDLDPKEMAQAEISWQRLGTAISDFMTRHDYIQ